MTNTLNEKRINQITTFLKSLNIKSKRFAEIIRAENTKVILDFNQALIRCVYTQPDLDYQAS